MRISPLSQKTILREQADAVGGGTPPADPPADPPAEPPADAGPDLSFIPEDFHGENGPDTAKFRETYDHMASRLAQLDERDIPDSAEGYEFALPEDLDFGDLELPEDFEPTIDPEAPIFQELAGVLHEAGAPKELAGKLVGLLAKSQAEVAAEVRQAAVQEMQALGPQAESRIRTVARSLETRIPDEGQRQALMSAVATADGLRALEKLLGSPGQKSPSPQPAAQDWEGMTPAERLKAIHASGRMKQRAARA